MAGRRWSQSGASTLDAPTAVALVAACTGPSPRSSAARKPAIVQSPAPVVPATLRARKHGDTTSRSHHASGFSDMRSQKSRTRAGSPEVRT